MTKMEKNFQLVYTWNYIGNSYQREETTNTEYF